MTALAIVTVKTFDLNEINQDRIISLDHVRQYQGVASNLDTRIIYNPTGDVSVNQIVADNTFASFDSVFQDKTNSVGIPLYFETVDRLEVNEQRVLLTETLIWAQQRPDGVTCDILYFTQNYQVHQAVVRTTLVGLYAAQYNPAAAIASELYRNDSEVGTTDAAHTVTVTFSSELVGTYKVYFTDTGATGMGIITDSIVMSSTGFTVDVLGTGDPLDFGSFDYLAILVK